MIKHFPPPHNLHNHSLTSLDTERFEVKSMFDLFFCLKTIFNSLVVQSADNISLGQLANTLTPIFEESKTRNVCNANFLDHLLNVSEG